MADSDDDFSSTTAQEPFLPRKSKLSKKKNKNKENVKKPHTSTQNEVPEPITSRGGRPARKTAEEIQFQRELEEALRISSTDVSSSSAEIVPVNSAHVLVNKAMAAVDEILVVSDSSQESVNHGLSSAETVDVIDEKVDTKEDSDDEDIVMKKRKFKVIDSDDEFETEVSRKPATVKPPAVLKQVTTKVNDAVKKRKVEETWVVSGNKKTNKTDDLKTTLKRTPKPVKKYNGQSSDSEDFSVDESGDNEEESDDEFIPVKTKKKTPVKKSTKPKTPTKIPANIPPPIATSEPNMSPKKPLGNHNPIPSPSIPLPKSKNMFQHKSPIKLAFKPKSPAATASKPPPTIKSITPGPTTSISSLLKQFQNQTKSTPIMGFKSQTPAFASPSPSTPIQKKMPGWTPPARIGTSGSSNLSPGLSPSIGLRVGLSRNFKSKPLHSGVKYP